MGTLIAKLNICFEIICQLKICEMLVGNIRCGCRPSNSLPNFGKLR